MVSTVKSVIWGECELVAGVQTSFTDHAAEAVYVVDELTSSHYEVIALKRHRAPDALCRKPTEYANRQSSSLSSIHYRRHILVVLRYTDKTGHSAV